MARRGGRRGGQGNRGRRSKANRSRSRSTKSSSRSKSTSSRRGGQGNKSRSTGRAKGTVSRKSVGKGLRSVAKAVGKVASKTKGFAGVGAAMRAAKATTSAVKTRKSKLRQQLSNLRRNVQQQSTKEARYNRRKDRLKRQHGLDYSRMNDSFKVGVNVDQAARHLGISDNRFYRALPKSIRSLKFHHQMKAPTKLGVRDGYRAPNRGGETVAANTRNQLASLRADPSQDIGMMYQNILGRESDQEGLDYWTNEFKSGRQNLEDIRRQFVRSDEFQGRSDADKSSALDGLKKRRMKRGLPRETRGVPKGRENDYRLLPMPMPTTGPKKGKGNNYGDQFIGHMGIGIPGSQEYRRSTPKRKGKPKRGGMRSIGAALASMRGGI